MTASVNPETLFSAVDSKGNLSDKSVMGGMTTISAQIAQFILSTATTVVLARLLTPADFGLIGMVSVIITFVTLLKSAGLSMATVQKEEISRDQISTLFWINVIISGFLGILVLSASSLVAAFYGKPELTAVTAALSVSFIISGLSIQHQALIKRHMRFGTLAIITIGSQLFNLIVAVALAFLGMRYWALVGGAVSFAVANTALTFIFCPWKPSKMQKGTGVRSMLKFGGHLTVFNIINYFSRNSDYIVIGKFLGDSELGLYTKAYHLFLFPISQIRTPINNVAMPALCSIKNNAERYRNYYKVIIFLIAALSMPIVSVMIVYSESVIRIMLGNQWAGAVDVFRILAVVGFIQAAAQAGRGLPLMSMGYSKRYLQFGIIQAIVTIVGIILGLSWGISGVAAGYAISFFILIPFTLRWCLKGSPVISKDWIHSIASPLFATLIMLPVMYFTKNAIQGDVDPFNASILSNIGIVLLGSAAGMIAYFLSLLLLPSGRGYCKKVQEQYLAMVRNRSKSKLSSEELSVNDK